MRRFAGLGVFLTTVSCGGHTETISWGSTAPVQEVGAIRILFGGASAPDSEQLHLSRLPRRLPGGGYVITNNRTQLLFLDTAGRLVRSAGRQGNGPGEFGSLWSHAVVRGDTVLAADPLLRRITLFDHRGRYAGAEVK